MTSHAPLLEKISIERSFIEFDKLLLAPHWKKGIKALLATKAYQYLPDFQETAEEWQSFVADYVEDFRFTSSEQAWAATLLALKMIIHALSLKNGRRLLISKRQFSP